MIEGEVHASHPISSGRRVQNHPRHLLLQQNVKVCPGLHCLQLMSDNNIKGDSLTPANVHTSLQLTPKRALLAKEMRKRHGLIGGVAISRTDANGKISVKLTMILTAGSINGQKARGEVEEILIEGELRGEPSCINQTPHE